MFQQSTLSDRRQLVFAVLGSRLVFGLIQRAADMHLGSLREAKKVVRHLLSFIG